MVVRFEAFVNGVDLDGITDRLRKDLEKMNLSVGSTALEVRVLALAWTVAMEEVAPDQFAKALEKGRVFLTNKKPDFVNDLFVLWVTGQLTLLKENRLMKRLIDHLAEWDSVALDSLKQDVREGIESDETASSSNSSSSDSDD